MNGGVGWGGAAALGEGLQLGSDLGCSSIAGKCREAVEIPSLLSGARPALRAFLPLCPPESVCNTPSKGELRGGMENIHRLEFNRDLSLVSVLSLCVWPWDATLWAQYSRLQKVRPPCPLLRAVVEVRWDD